MWLTVQYTVSAPRCDCTVYSICATMWLYSVQYTCHIVTVHYYWARRDCTLLLSSSWLFTITEFDVIVHYYCARRDCTLLLSWTWLFTTSELNMTVHYYLARRDCTQLLSSTWLYTITELDVTVHYYWALRDCTLLLSSTWLYTITELDVTVHNYWARHVTVHYVGVRGWRHILPSAYVPYICWSYGDRKCNSWRGFYHF